MIKVAICDDAPCVAKCMKRVLEEHEFCVNMQVDEFVSGWELLKSAMQKRYDIILLDIELFPPGGFGQDGMSLSNKIKDVYLEVIVIFFYRKFRV